MSTESLAEDVGRREDEDPAIGETDGHEPTLDGDMLSRAMLQATSHEIRSPLSVILSLVETIRLHRQKLSEQDLDAMLADMSSSLRRLHRMLDDLTDVQRGGPTGIRRRPVQLATAVGRAMGEVDVDRHPVDVLARGEATIDAALFERIVVNLVRNAVVHTPSGTRIAVSAEGADDGGCVLEVRDDGPGIPAHLADRVFTPFVRGPDTAFRPGTGIGLALVRQFAEAHGGDAFIVPSATGLRTKVRLGGGGPESTETE